MSVIAFPNELKVIHKGFIIEGVADICLWGGGDAQIEMSPVTIKKNTISEDDIKNSINDGGFGCEMIKGADLFIYAYYEPELPEHLKDMNFTSRKRSIILVHQDYFKK